MGNSFTPLVCICIPAYNSGETLCATLDSVLGQTYRNISVLVVDNASSDNTLEIADARSARDNRVRVLRHVENVGPEGNFTRCLKLASGDYTAIFHSDDIYAPSMVSEQVAFLEKYPQAGAVFTMAESIDTEGNPDRLYELPPELIRAEGYLYNFPEIFRALLKYGNFLFCPSAMARTPVYRDYIKVWDAGNYYSSADLDVWLRILKLYPVGILPAPLLRYRGAALSSFSYTALRKKTEPHDMLRVFEEYSTGFASEFMGAEERADLRMLVLKDNLNRAFNLSTSGKNLEAIRLLPGLFRLRTIWHALKSRLHMKVLLFGCAVFLLVLLPLGSRLRHRLFALRHS